MKVPAHVTIHAPRRPASRAVLLALGGCLWAAVLGCDRQTQVEVVAQSPHLAFDGAQTQIVSIDVDRIGSLTIQRRIREALLSDPARGQWWTELTAALGGDPLEIVDRLVLAFHGQIRLDDPLANALVVAVGRFDDPRSMFDRFARFVGDRHLVGVGPVKAGVHHGFDMFSIEGESFRSRGKNVEIHAAFPSHQVAILSRSRERVLASLEVMKGVRDGIASDSGWRARLTEVDLSAAIWACGDFPSSINEYLLHATRSQPELEGLAGLTNSRRMVAALVVGREFSVNLSLRCESIDKAGALRAALDSARTIVPRLLTEALGEGNWRISIWRDFFDGFVAIQDIDSARLSRRMDLRAVEDFVRSVTTPPSGRVLVEIPEPFRRTPVPER